MNPVEEIKSKLDIVDVIGEYVPLKRAGRNFKALCPFHSEKTPSFMVSSELQIFKCFGCGTGGDAFAFLQKIEDMEFPEALRILAKRTGVKIVPFKGDRAFAEKERLYQINHLAAEFYHYLLTGHLIGRGALAYLTNRRKLAPQSIEIFKIGFAPDKRDALISFLTKKKNYTVPELERAGLVVRGEGKIFDRFRGRIVFPLRDHRGNTLGFSGRILPGDEGKDLAKYVNTPETPIYQKRRHLFGLDVTREDVKKAGAVVAVEGEFDLISSWQAGIKNVVAIKGSALTVEHTKLLLRFCQQLILALDTDLINDFAARRGVEIAQQEGLAVRVVDLGTAKDPDELARQNPQDFKTKVERAIPVYDFLMNSIFSRANPATGNGKAMISQLFIPVLSGIPDKIVQAHYILEFAAKLGVPEEAVAAQVESVAAPKTPLRREGVPEASPLKTRRELLEEQLLSLVLQGDPGRAKEELSNLIKSPSLVRIHQEVVKFLKENKNFNPSKLAASLPGELVEPFATLLLADIGDFLDDPQKFDRVLAQTKREIKIVDLKGELAQVASRIKELEKKGGKEFEDKKNEFTRLSRELSRLVQS